MVFQETVGLRARAAHGQRKDALRVGELPTDEQTKRSRHPGSKARLFESAALLIIGPRDLVHGGTLLHGT
jgi:hypothetical protein